MVSGLPEDLGSPPAARSEAPAVALRGVVKRYAGVTALAEVSLDIETGSVHALVGENGAGKSTLGKIISGAVRHDEGTLEVLGSERAYRSPHEALGDGVAAIQQEIALVPARSVVENVFLGIELRSRGLPSPRRMRARLAEVQEEMGFHLRPDDAVGGLSVADQQKVEILRAVVREARIIVMDEPTAALGPDEVAGLFETIRDLKRGGATIIFVSHRLEEVKAISERVTVLRNGRLVGTWPTGEIEASQIVEQMLGRSLAEVFPDLPPAPGPEAKTVLRVEGLSNEVLHDVSLDLRAGEIVGVAGLVGSGRTEMVRAIFGADDHSGAVEVLGTAVSFRTPRDAVRGGVALLPESRKESGLVVGQSVEENLTLANLPRLKSWWGGVDGSAARRQVQTQMDSMDIRPRRPKRIVNTLSGGNQQKVLFGKWLGTEPRVLLADEPTRGVDVGAKFAIYEVLARLAKEGLGILMISSELPEVLGMAHRVLVMRNGSVVADLPRGEATEDGVMHAAFGTESQVPA